MSQEFHYNGHRVVVIATECEGRWSWEYLVDGRLCGFMTDRSLANARLAIDVACRDAKRAIDLGIAARDAVRPARAAA